MGTQSTRHYVEITDANECHIDDQSKRKSKGKGKDEISGAKTLFILAHQLFISLEIQIFVSQNLKSLSCFYIDFV